MDCPECGAPTVDFAVPADLREAAPSGSGAAAICTQCLRLFPVEEGSTDPDFSRIIEAFPDADEGGIPMALAVGLLVESLALNRQSVAALLEQVIDTNVDPWLVLERLAVSPTVQPDADIERASRQLEQLLG